ncbi:MAG: ATP-binding cassette domain-containing protein [Microgenomates group bacterium]
MSLEVQDLSFGYKKNVPIISNFSMNMSMDERVGITAPSGYGKTTLCKLIAGYIKPHSGKVLLDGRDIHEIRGYNPIQMVWQHPEKSVNPRLRMSHVIEAGDMIEDRVIDGLGIEREWYNRYPSELSGGEIQRFCIARALGKSTKFIVADEISTMLDLITQSQIWNFLLEEIQQRGIGLIAITHSNALMDRIATRYIDIENL